MTRNASRDVDDAPGELPEAGHGMPAGYDDWKLATPPEYEFLGEAPRRERRRPIEPWMCGQAPFPCFRWLCTQPANHNGRCNTFGEAA